LQLGKVLVRLGIVNKMLGRPAVKTGARRKARELALSVLFATDVGQQPFGRVLGDIEHTLRVLVEEWELGREEAARLVPEIREFGLTLAEAYFKDHLKIDEHIEGFSHEWAIDRMPGIDRNILRLAIAELLHFPDVPVSATINEAVELAKQYGTEESGKFVNGVLGAFVRSEQASVNPS
jgi:transcription antitermination protein NusB